MKILLLLSLAITTTQVFANLKMDRAWFRISDPLIMNIKNYKYSDLPKSGRLSDRQKGWSSDYWARKKGSINYRWNTSSPTGFNYVSPTRDQVFMMSQRELRRLSPSEKWDLFLGRYDYPLKNEVASYARPDRPLWEGICDGWAGAAMNHDEPKPLSLLNPDGIQIPFGSSDIKGLISWYYSRKYSGGYAQMGRRCYGDNSEERCQHDMNAGAFHLVLTNRLGVQGRPFIADVDRNFEVWNHLASSYSSRVLDSEVLPLPTSALGTVNMVKMRTTVRYVWLLSRNRWWPVLGTDYQNTEARTYEYYLDLDAEGQVIGGEWISRGRPDFLWLERKVPFFRGMFQKLPMLLNED